MTVTTAQSSPNIYSLVIDGRRCWFRDDGISIAGPLDTSRNTSNVWWAPEGHHDYDPTCGFMLAGPVPLPRLPQSAD